MSITPCPTQDLHHTRALLGSLQSAEASLVSARELVLLAQERMRLAKENIRSGEERGERLPEVHKAAREHIANVRLILAGANDLCRISRRYLAEIEADGRESAAFGLNAVAAEKRLEAMLGNANQLVLAAGRAVMIAYGQAGRLDYELKKQERRIAQEERLVQHRPGGRLVASELLALVEDELERAQAHVKSAEDRVCSITAQIG